MAVYISNCYCSIRYYDTVNWGILCWEIAIADELLNMIPMRSI